MNRILPVVAAAWAAMLLTAAVAAEQEVAPKPTEASGPIAVTTPTSTATETPTVRRELQRESEPEWPQSRCEAPAE